MTQFEVSSSGPDRVRVAWETDDADFYFIAKVKGDEVVEITSGLRPWPVVFRMNRGGASYRDRTTYHPASDYEAIVEEAKALIRNEKLASAAMDARKAERAAFDARQIAEKAGIIRAKLIERRLTIIPEASDTLLADLYDSIQNATV